MLELSLLFAGFIYIITPGPVFLAILSLVSEQGIKKGFKFVIGASLGCMVWFSITFFTLTQSHILPDILFKILALLCGAYLFWMAYNLITKSINKSKEIIFKRPFYDGLLLALFNPKSYPVMTAVFGAIFLNDRFIVNGQFVYVFCLSVFGFWLGYLFMLIMANIKPVIIFYNKYIDKVRLIFGIVFIYFGLILLRGTL